MSRWLDWSRILGGYIRVLHKILPYFNQRNHLGIQIYTIVAT